MKPNNTPDVRTELLTRGYRYHVDNTNLHHTNHLYQLKVNDDDGTRYYINAYYYAETSTSVMTIPETVQFECVLYNNDSEPVINASLYTQIPVEAEAYYDVMWRGLGLGYESLYPKHRDSDG